MIPSSIQKKHAIVFGGCGFVGRNLITALAHDDWTITVLTRRPHRHRDLLVFPNLKVIECHDFSHRSIESFVQSADTVVNLIGILNASKGNSFQRIHAQIPADIAQACLNNDARRLVHIGSLGANPDAPSEYLRSKASGQQAVLNSGSEGLDCIVIRPSVIFGPDDSFSQKFAQLLRLSKWFFPLVCPNAKMQPVFVDDVIRAIVHAMSAQTLDTRVVDLAGPEVLTLRQIVATIDKLCGSRHQIIGLNDSLSMMLARFAQLVPSQPITADNIRSLRQPNVLEGEIPAPFGKQASGFEETAKSWLRSPKDSFNALRTHAGR